MREAFRFFTIAFGLLIGIILIMYYFSDFLSSRLVGELMIVFGYGFIIYSFITDRFQRPVLKNKIILRTKEYNWFYLIFWTFFGLLKIRDGYTNSVHHELLFGFLKEDYAQGFGFILLSVVFLKKNIRIDEKGIRFQKPSRDQIDFSEVESVHIQQESIEIRTDSEAYTYKIRKLTEKEIAEIYNKIEAFKKSTGTPIE